ncbi:BA14K family protein [Rhizobium sp. YIM 134829]|uniref:BA14K family protein n=1 Tax=Rhizobium sp. YIM 134829 TaxID=3390453 RepID=UPI00397BC70E
MRTLLWVSAAIYTSAAVFAAGFFSATALMARPATQVLASADISDLWTSSPKVVEPGAQKLERVAALTFPKPTPVEETSGQDSLLTEADAPLGSDPGIDREATGAIAPNGPDSNADYGQQPMLNPDHLAWCERRYRSYDPSDNSYRSYSGSRRSCVSPFQQQADSGPLPAASDEGGEVMAINMSDGSEADGFVGDIGPSDDHIRRCSARYASYRVEDNSYRAFSGERRPCQLD